MFFLFVLLLLTYMAFLFFFLSSAAIFCSRERTSCTRSSYIRIYFSPDLKASSSAFAALRRYSSAVIYSKELFMADTFHLNTGQFTDDFFQFCIMFLKRLDHCGLCFNKTALDFIFPLQTGNEFLICFEFCFIIYPHSYNLAFYKKSIPESLKKANYQDWGYWHNDGG